MAQVSDSTSSIQEAIGALQSKGPRSNKPVEDAENGRSDRLDQRKESNNGRQARQTEDRVLISPEAQNQTRESQVVEGTRNGDNLQPPSEQRASERGASQRLTDQNGTNTPGTRNYEGGGDQVQAQSIPPNNTQEINAQRTRTESREEAATRDQITSEARSNQSSEVPLRDLQNKDETLIEPKKLSKSAEEIEGPRERAEAAKETVFDIPSQRIIQEVEPSFTQTARTANINVRDDQTESDRQPPSPTSVQTETGQNVDDLI